MPTSFFQYEMLPTTWFYVSTLIILAVFFKFNRFWSIRNFDLLGLILLTPGMLMLAMKDDPWGYAWLFIIAFFTAIRMIVDTVMVRRPLLEPNLTPGGLTFSCFFLISFIVLAITVNRGEQIDTVRTIRLEQILTVRNLEKKVGMDPITLTVPSSELNNLPPGFLPFHIFTERTNLIFVPPANIRRQILESPVDSPFAFSQKGFGVDSFTASSSDIRPEVLPNTEFRVSPSKLPTPTLLSETNGETNDPASLETESPATPLLSIAPPSLSMLSLAMGTTIAGHLLIVLAFIYIGHCHFGNMRTGIACATLYLLHPYTNQMVTRLDHILPAALILWGIAMYRRPFFSGFWIGTAGALVFYPIFLVPLWCSFYWRRGWIRFVIGVASAAALFLILLLFSPDFLGSYGNQLLHLLGKSSLWIFTQSDGFWISPDLMMYRVPILAGYVVLCFGMILWPSNKHLATLLSCSALLMLGVQFWQLHEGGLFIAWYLPLVILTIFRPNLEDRVAQSIVVS